MPTTTLASQYKARADKFGQGNPPGEPHAFTGLCYASGQNGATVWSGARCWLPAGRCKDRHISAVSDDRIQHCRAPQSFGAVLRRVNVDRPDLAGGFSYLAQATYAVEPVEVGRHSQVDGNLGFRCRNDSLLLPDAVLTTCYRPRSFAAQVTETDRRAVLPDEMPLTFRNPIWARKDLAGY
jgi:hypothetical protein